MKRLMARTMTLLLTLVCCAATADPFAFGPPPGDGPVVVQAGFELNDINNIDDQAEVFEFAGVLTLKWHDPRQAFDPAVAGVQEKVYQGDYQFKEIATGWFPQAVLVNESAYLETSGVILRVKPDGTSILTRMMNGAAETELRLRRFPFDEQRLEAIFAILGFDRDEVILQVDPQTGNSDYRDVRIPEWGLIDVSVSTPDRASPYAGSTGIASTFVVSIDVERKPLFEQRLVIIPLIIIVLLSFSVFWMDKSSLGDRVSVSFIGILTAVTYQLVMVEQLPRLSYSTLMHEFLSISFVTVCATVLVNLAVSGLDKAGNSELGNRVDLHCRWVFPLVYFAILLTLVGVDFLL